MDLWHFDQHFKKLDEVATDISFVVNPSSSPDQDEEAAQANFDTAPFVQYVEEEDDSDDDDEEGQSDVEEKECYDNDANNESLCLSRSLEAGKREKGFSISQTLPQKEFTPVTRMKRSHSTVEKRQKPTAAEALGACNSKEDIREALRFISTKQSKELQSCWLIIQRLVDKLKEQSSTKEELVKENNHLRRQLSGKSSSPVAIKVNNNITRPDESPKASPHRASSPLSPCTTALKRRKNLNDSFPTSPKKTHF